MKHLTLLVCAALALGACSRGDNPDGLFGNNLSGGGAIDPAGADLLAGLDSRGIPQDSLQFLTEVIGDRVFFIVDQSTLTPDARRILDLQAAWLNQRTDLPVLIEGHADEQGTTDYNIALSNRRAAAVRDYLVTRGVSDQRLSIIGFGKARPVAVCSDESCWSQNRRAVTVVTGGAGV